MQALFCSLRHLSLVAVIIAIPLFAMPSTSVAGIMVYNVILDGPSESPPNASPGTGTATITIDTIVESMRVEASFSGLIGTTTAAHIHAATAMPLAGAAGVATQVPSFSGFPLGVTAGSYDHTFDMTLAGSFNPSFMTANGGTPASAFAALIAAADGGRAYPNIHSTFAPGGEIRGFLTPAVPEPSSLLIGLITGGVVVCQRRWWRRRNCD